MFMTASPNFKTQKNKSKDFVNKLPELKLMKQFKTKLSEELLYKFLDEFLENISGRISKNILEQIPRRIIEIVKFPEVFVNKLL